MASTYTVSPSGMFFHVPCTPNPQTTIHPSGLSLSTRIHRYKKILYFSLVVHDTIIYKGTCLTSLHAIKSKGKGLCLSWERLECGRHRFKNYLKGGKEGVASLPVLRLSYCALFHDHLCPCIIWLKLLQMQRICIQIHFSPNPQSTSCLGKQALCNYLNWLSKRRKKEYPIKSFHYIDQWILNIKRCAYNCQPNKVPEQAKKTTKNIKTTLLPFHQVLQINLSPCITAVWQFAISDGQS